MTRGVATTDTYPVPSGNNPQLDTGNVKANYYSVYQNMVYHSNGTFYLAAKNGANDAFIFNTDGTVINRIAGITGANGYLATDSGNPALGSKLKFVQHMIEIPSGVYAGDLLILDQDRIRRVSIVTDAGNPKIFDVFDLTTVTGYNSNATFKDWVYDQTTEQGGVLGTGTIYYVDGADKVRKIVPNAALTGGTDSTYNFSGTTLSGIVRIALTPVGLLVLQPSVPRILKIAP